MKFLPGKNPNLDYLKKEAANFKRLHQNKDSSICEELRHYEFILAGKSDSEILASPFTLNDAQRVIARQYGFSSWTKIKRYVSASEPCKHQKLAQRLVDIEKEYTSKFHKLKTEKISRFDARVNRH